MIASKPVIASADIPDWVPVAVKSMAIALPVGKAIARHLLTDRRMKAVWQVLHAQNVKPDAIAMMEPSKRMATWGISDHNVSLRDQACAAYFAFAVIEFSNARNVWTRAQTTKWAKDWDTAAQLCRWISGDPMFDADFAKAAAVMAPGFEKHAALLRAKGRLVDLGQNDAPYILDRSSKNRGDDEVRGRVRALADETHKIFGAFLYGTVATVATVALQIKPEVNERSVRNWCVDLPCR